MAEGPGVDELDQLAETLQDDPVLVDPLFGNGRTEQVREALGEIVDGLDFPAYVVMVPRPEGLSANDPDRELATLLHERIGGDAVFVVHTDTTGYADAVVSFGDVPEERLIGAAWSEHAPDGGANVDLAPAGIAARSLEILSSGGDMSGDEFDSYAEQAVWRDPPEWDLDYEVPGEGHYAMFTTMAFVVVAGCAWLVLRTLARWRETAPPAGRSKASATKGAGRKPARAPQRMDEAAELGPVEVRARAERELDGLAARLSSAAGRSQPEETRVLVDGSYDTARTVLERTGTALHDLDDLVGALVLVRVAARALTTRRTGWRAYRPCFFDPRHGEGTLTRTVPVGDRELEVPACTRCSRRADDALVPMLVPKRPVAGLVGRGRPWYELDTVWARTGYGAFVDDLWQHVASALREAR